MVMYNFSEENNITTLQECFGLCRDHFYEVGDSHQVKEFDVDWHTLAAMMSAGVMSVLVARKDGAVVGYFMNLISRDLLTASVIAKELAIYVAPEHRKGRLFFLMNKEVEKLLVEKGVDTQHITFVYGHNEKMPIKLGFTPLEITYKKHLGV